MEPEVQEIDLRELMFIILKRWWIFILLFVVAVTAAGIISYYYLEPIYESTTTLFVGKEQRQGQEEQAINYADVMLNEQLVKDYRELAKSKSVSRDVIESMGLSLTVGQLRGKIAVDMIQDTRVFKISITDTDPVLATDIANGLAEVFIAKATEIMKVENVQVIDMAEVPQGPIKPNPMMNMAIAGVLGIMIGLGIIFLLEYLDNTLKKPTDIERYLQLSVLGTIPVIQPKKGEA